ncbi:unnamed protein product [Sympodiomycopsis kandeliae]
MSFSSQPPSFSSFVAPTAEKKDSSERDRGSRHSKRRERGRERERDGGSKTRDRTRDVYDDTVRRSDTKGKKREIRLDDYDRRSASPSGHRQRHRDRDQDHRRRRREHSTSDSDEHSRRQQDSSRRREDSNRDPHRTADHPASSLPSTSKRTLEWANGMVDTHGDIRSAQYGRVDPSKVPLYSRVWHDKVLGLPGHVRVQLDGREAKRGRRLQDKEWERSSLHTGKIKKVRPSEGQSGDKQGQEDYIPLSRPKHTDVSVRSMMEEDARSESSDESSSEEEHQSSLIPSHLQARLHTLNTRIESDAGDILAWQDLSKLQREISTATTITQDSTEKTRQVQAQVELSIIQKALRSNPTNTSLRLSQVRLVSEYYFWEVQDVVKEWDEIFELRHTPKDVIDVCKGYLDWILQGQDPQQSIWEVLEGYMRCLSRLHSRIQDDPSVVQYCTRLQSELCQVLRQARYPALAFGILQAQLEICFPLRRQDESIRSFWESQDTRYGEPHLPHRKMKSEAGFESQDSFLCNFIKLQIDLTALRSFPARTTDTARYSEGEGEVDPFSMVFFEDLGPFLLHLDGGWEEEVLESVFGYLGLQRGVESMDVDEFWLGSRSFPSGEDNWASLLPSPPSEVWPSRTSRITSQTDVETISTIIDQLQSIHTTSMLRILRIGLELQSHGYKSAATLSKSLLSDHNQDWTLWQAYALLERQFGTPSKAGKVYISLLQSEDLHQQDVREEVWRQWIEMELSLHDESKAMELLDHAAAVQFGRISTAFTHTAAEKLKARQLYNRSQSPMKSLDVQACSVWYEYLSGDGAFEEAIQRWNTVATVLTSDESKIQWRHTEIRLINYHIHLHKRAYRPALVREALTQAVQNHGNEHLFMDALVAHEQRFRIDGIVKKTIHEVLLAKEEDITLGRILTSVYTLFHLNSSNVHYPSVRSIFERCVNIEHLSARETNTIWKLYLSFELHILKSVTIDKRQRKECIQRAKNVLYRSLAEYPYDGDVYLTAMRMGSHGILTSAEMLLVGQSMDERGIRVFGWRELRDRLAGEDEERRD